jgi:DNA uptake protein ComE-like DNA-binding protein
MKKPFQSIFIFTKKEQRGLVVLLLLCFCLVIGRHIWIRHQVEVNWMPYQDSTMVSFLAGLHEKPSSTTLREYHGSLIDLNTATEQDLLNLGFSVSLAERFLRYRSAGGAFFTPDDVKRVYGIDDELWHHLAPHIYFPKPSYETLQKVSEEYVADEYQQTNEQFVADEPDMVALNDADTFELMQLPGIGRVFAERILSYRDLLGGYSSALQLMEVYGMTEERFSQCSTFISVETQNLRKLSLNTADFTTLLRHPYLSRKQVQTLMAFRQYTDSSITYQGLMEHHVLDSANLKRLLPYLSFDK